MAYIPYGVEFRLKSKILLFKLLDFFQQRIMFDILMFDIRPVKRTHSELTGSGVLMETTVEVAFAGNITIVLVGPA
jgi:hypothetical protein